jgi:hypothetical protein
MSHVQQAEDHLLCKSSSSRSPVSRSWRSAPAPSTRAKTVQLDLEAKGLIAREDKAASLA